MTTLPVGSIVSVCAQVRAGLCRRKCRAASCAGVWRGHRRDRADRRGDHRHHARRPAVSHRLRQTHGSRMAAGAPRMPTSGPVRMPSDLGGLLSAAPCRWPAARTSSSAPDTTSVIVRVGTGRGPDDRRCPTMPGTFEQHLIGGNGHYGAPSRQRQRGGALCGRRVYFFAQTSWS